MELLIPILVPIITELLKILAGKMGVELPKASLPASTPVQGVALGSLIGADPSMSALLGAAGSWAYEVIHQMAKARK